MEKLAKQNTPKKFTEGSGNVLVDHQASFERQCAMIEKHFHIKANDLTLYQFISRLEAIKEDLKSQSKSGLVTEQPK